MPPIGQREITADQLVEVQQQVAVEGGGDPQRIVVSGFENRSRLEQIDADQQPACLRRLACLALCLLALVPVLWLVLWRAGRRYGPLARTVLDRWNVRCTADFGKVVFALIDVGVLRKTEDDSFEDFVDVYAFDEAFAEGELI